MENCGANSLCEFDLGCGRWPFLLLEQKGVESFDFSFSIFHFEKPRPAQSGGGLIVIVYQLILSFLNVSLFRM